MHRKEDVLTTRDAGTRQAPRPAGLSPEELEAEQAAELPDREAMSPVNANLAIPINAGVAANVLSDGSTAVGGAL